jgi:hypothetical protein
MGDKIQTGDISNNNGQIQIGNGNEMKLNSKDDFAKKSFHWQKWGVIISSILSIMNPFKTRL